MRIVIVDDSPSVRDARQLWLREATDAQVDALDFEGALALGTRWGQVDIAVLDGHDRRSPERRAAAARRSGVWTRSRRTTTSRARGSRRRCAGTLPPASPASS